MATILEDLKSIKRLAEEIKPGVTKRDLLTDVEYLAKMYFRYTQLEPELGFAPANRKMESEFSDKWDYHKESIWTTYDQDEKKRAEKQEELL